eukprot:2012894-Rhodomonas_salina.2
MSERLLPYVGWNIHRKPGTPVWGSMIKSVCPSRTRRSEGSTSHALCSTVTEARSGGKRELCAVT